MQRVDTLHTKTNSCWGVCHFWLNVTCFCLHVSCFFPWCWKMKLVLNACFDWRFHKRRLISDFTTVLYIVSLLSNREWQDVDETKGFRWTNCDVSGVYVCVCSCVWDRWMDAGWHRRVLAQWVRLVQLWWSALSQCPLERTHTQTHTHTPMFAHSTI